jgi:hypothetical protein
MHGERVEQGALLKDNPNLSTKLEEFLFPHLGYVFAQGVDVAAVRPDQSNG